jgi:hypothetical protein
MSKKVSQPWFLLGNGKLTSQKRKDEENLFFLFFLFK